MRVGEYGIPLITTMIITEFKELFHKMLSSTTYCYLKYASKKKSKLLLSKVAKKPESVGLKIVQQRSEHTKESSLVGA